jgi:poly-gamma-glutamate synthesis protein (capsule biosynthesis protein)
MLKGIENYKGKAIFHGLGQFVPVVAGLTDAQIKERRISRPPNLSGVYNIQQTPDQYLTMIAKFLISDKKISRLSYLPVLVNEQRQPEVVKHDHRGQQVFDFMEMLNKEEDLNTGYEWEDDEVVVRLR